MKVKEGSPVAGEIAADLHSEELITLPKTIDEEENAYSQDITHVHESEWKNRDEGTHW